MALSDRLRKRRPEEAERQSVFGEILDWMLMPLLLIWPLSVILIQNVANSIADDPYDQALADNALAIARLVALEGGRVRVGLTPQARSVLRTHSATVRFERRATRRSSRISASSSRTCSLLLMPIC